MLLLLYATALGNIEGDFKRLVHNHLPTLDTANGKLVWCAFIPGLCDSSTVVSGSFEKQIRDFAVSNGYDLSTSTSNDCNLYDGPGSDLYFGSPKLDPADTRFWQNASRVMASPPGDFLIAADVRHLSSITQSNDMLCPCALGMECTFVGPHLPKICTVLPLSHNTNDMWVIVLILLAIGVVVLYVATDDIEK